MTSASPAETVDVVPYRATATGVRLMIRLTPGAGRDGIDGQVHDPDGRALLRVRIRARPVEGAANLALVRFLAAALQVKSGDIAIATGETSRVKRLEISGDPVQLAARLALLVSAPH